MRYGAKIRVCLRQTLLLELIKHLRVLVVPQNILLDTIVVSTFWQEKEVKMQE